MPTPKNMIYCPFCEQEYNGWLGEHVCDQEELAMCIQQIEAGIGLAPGAPSESEYRQRLAAVKKWDASPKAHTRVSRQFTGE